MAGFTNLHFNSETALKSYAAKLANSIQSPCVIFLSGILGTGKTTFVRGFLRGLGLQDPVKSPSFTILESYEIGDQTIYHFDFYRIKDREELINLGLRDCLENGILLIEWPEHVQSYLPKPDLHYRIVINQEDREISIEAASPLGQRILEELG